MGNNGIAQERIYDPPPLRGKRTSATGLLDLGVLHTFRAGTNPAGVRVEVSG